MSAAPSVRLPYPHAGQQTVRRQARRFNWLAAGRRWRKTTLAMSISVEGAAAGRTVIWGAPTYNQVRIGMDETYKAAGGVADFNLSRMEVAFPRGGRILFRSLDNPDNARGLTADGIVLDESADVKAAAWYEVLRPMLIDTGGWLWSIGTPKGRNWWWVEHQAAADRPDAIAWQVPTLGVAVADGQLVRAVHPLENGAIPFVEIERLYATMSERVFLQEILAQFVEDGGGVFRGVRKAATAKEQERALRGHVYLAGLDFGRQNDFTVMTVLDTLTNEIVAMDRFNQIDYHIQTGRIAALAQRFQPAAIVAESNSIGVPMIEQLTRLGLPIVPFTTTSASKQIAIDALALAFEREQLRILPDPTLIAELEAYEMERLPSGMLRYSAPDGMHDDTVMALALTWYGAVRGGAPYDALARQFDYLG
jgi:hypothetical protein